MSARDSDRLRKDIIGLFQSFGLKIEITCNLHQVNFLDVTFNLQTERFSPYRKPNDTPLYINSKSNHPPSILKQLPGMISDRISSISCDATEFEKAKRMYDDSLKKSGFQEEISFRQTHDSSARPHNRKRQIIWFNPPYNERVKTNIGKTFLRLLAKHFPPQHRYHKIFNRNKVKLSYSCMPNMSQAISCHNKKVLASCKPVPLEQNNRKTCNCRRQAECPLEGNCLEECVIYKASVSSSDGEKQYLGLTEGPFKTRFNLHKTTFNHSDKAASTTLSKYIWELKEKSTPYEIKWSVVQSCRPYRCGTRMCSLCLSEKYHILMSDDSNCLNKNSELLQKCRHANKFKLGNVT